MTTPRKKPRVSVVVVTYHSESDILQALSPLTEAVGAGDVEIIVIDNASGDDTCNTARQFSSPINVIELDANIGYGRACNLGWRRALGEYVLFLNPDATIEAVDLLVLANFLDQHPEAGLCAPVIQGERGNTHKVGGMPKLPQDFNRLLWGYEDQRLEPSPGQPSAQVDWLSGAIQLARKSMLQQLRGFDERFFLYFEETDLAYRAQQLNWQIWIVGSALAFHKGAQSAKRTDEMLINGVIAKHFYASRYYYYGKNFGWSYAATFEILDKSLSFVRLLWRKLRGNSPAQAMTRLANPMLKLPQAQSIRWRATHNRSGEIVARPALRNDIPALTPFLDEVFLRWPQLPINVSNDEYLEWKMARSSDQIGWILTQNGEPIASNLRITQPVWVFGEKLMASQGVDTAVCSICQGRGHHPTLQRARDENAASDPQNGSIRSGYSSNPAIIKLWHSKGREPISISELTFKLASAVHIANAKNVYNSPAPRWLMSLRNQINGLTQPSIRAPSPEFEFRPVTQFSTATDNLFSSFPSHFAFTVDKNSQYMAWRYLQSPRNYQVVGAFRGDQIVGYAVYINDANYISITDIVAPVDQPSSVEALMRWLVCDAADQRAAEVKLWMTHNHPWLSMIIEIGFRESKQISGNIRRTNPSHERIEAIYTDDAVLNIAMGDTDWI